LPEPFPEPFPEPEPPPLPPLSSVVPGAAAVVSVEAVTTVTVVAGAFGAVVVVTVVVVAVVEVVDFGAVVVVDFGAVVVVDFGVVVAVVAAVAGCVVDGVPPEPEPELERGTVVPAAAADEVPDDAPDEVPEVAAGATVVADAVASGTGPAAPTEPDPEPEPLPDVPEVADVRGRDSASCPAGEATLVVGSLPAGTVDGGAAVDPSTTEGATPSASTTSSASTISTGASSAARRPGLVHTERAVSLPGLANSASRTAHADPVAARIAQPHATITGARRPGRRRIRRPARGDAPSTWRTDAVPRSGAGRNTVCRWSTSSP
jgi:hypothetical protein